MEVGGFIDFSLEDTFLRLAWKFVELMHQPGNFVERILIRGIEISRRS